MKSTYEELAEAIDSLEEENSSFGWFDYDSVCKRVCNQHGWTVKEYDLELSKRSQTKSFDDDITVKDITWKVL